MTSVRQPRNASCRETETEQGAAGKRSGLVVSPHSLLSRAAGTPFRCAFVVRCLPAGREGSRVVSRSVAEPIGSLELVVPCSAVNGLARGVQS